MNVSKIFNALTALNMVSGGDVESLTMSERPNWRTRHGKTRSIDQLTTQQTKLAIALSDTSYPTLHNALAYKIEFVQADNDLAKFYGLIAGSSVDNPINNAKNLLRGL